MVFCRLHIAISIARHIQVRPLIARRNILSDLTTDPIVLESLSQSHVTLDTVDLELNGQDGGVEREQQYAVEKQDPSCQEAELPEASLDTRARSANKDNNLNEVVPNDLRTSLFDGSLDCVLNCGGG